MERFTYEYDFSELCPLVKTDGMWTGNIFVSNGFYAARYEIRTHVAALRGTVGG
jgi:hypothetical protein